ncbi:hypothetical protein TIFTF001_034507 [Ficus carica]|uniref:Ferredoxin thioredoxin reductase alpha chain domain-containing protein n=1 Tax=Ficus carica TaxID=3494 RepID=A0AA88E1F2_FICCA|nr:hypothetical protein TIFTF001_034507 [Ficus carica]
MSTATVGLLSSASTDHAMILGAMKPSSIPSSPSSSSSRLSVSFSSRKLSPFPASTRRRGISCEVAIKSDSATSSSSSADLSESPSSSSPATSDDDTGGARIGARVRVKVPLKVYHVPKAPEIDITGLEGVLKQYVGLWKGKRISANLPYKVEFVTEVEGRGRVKFFAHLRDDEFEYV